MQISVALLASGFSLAAPNPPDTTSAYKTIYVFGDSYSDIGEGYLDGNGPTAVFYFAEKLGIHLLPSNAQKSPDDSLDFAVSGADTGTGAGRKCENALVGYGMQNRVHDS